MSRPRAISHLELEEQVCLPEGSWVVLLHVHYHRLSPLASSGSLGGLMLDWELGGVNHVSWGVASRIWSFSCLTEVAVGAGKETAPRLLPAW